MYAFVFDKRSLSRLVAGTVLAAGLLVFAGVLIGLRLNLPQDTTQDATQVVADLTRSTSVEPRRVRSPTAPPPPVTTPPPPTTIAPPPPVTAPPPLVTVPPPPTTVPPQVPGLAPAPPVAEIPPPAVASPPPVATVTAPPATAFAIQVAAYTLDVNARREISTLAARGYEPYVLSTRRVDGKPILRVVIGSYASRQEASRAAARFTAEEQRDSLVRPVAEI